MLIVKCIKDKETFLDADDICKAYSAHKEKYSSDYVVEVANFITVVDIMKYVRDKVYEISYEEVEYYYHGEKLNEVL